MALDADQGCRHPRWRTDFAANGKLHDFCLSCGAERRSSRQVDGGDTARLRNGLRWIRHVAAMNAVADPADAQQQMRALTLLAEKLLDGEELADYDSSIGAARSKTQEWAASVGIDIAAVDESGHGTPAPGSGSGTGAGIDPAAAEPLPGPRATERASSDETVDPVRTVITLDA